MNIVSGGYMEIEKKFMIKRRPENLGNYPKKEIEQGYLASNPVVRIRKSNDEYILTYKARLNERGSEVIVNKEVELPLTKEAYEHLRDKADNNLIIKTRYLIPLEDGLMGEYDVFHGKLEGLEFVEVEFESEEKAEVFKKPEWFGENVSSDKRFSNRFLSLIEKAEDLSI